MNDQLAYSVWKSAKSRTESGHFGRETPCISARIGV